MSRFLHACPLLLLLAPGMPLGAEQRREIAVTPLELSEDGQPILQVTLKAKTNPEQSRTLRFLLNTASAMNILDLSVPPAFFWEDLGPFLAPAQGSDPPQPAPGALLKRLEIGGISRDDVPCGRVDLTRLVNIFLDHPVDGVLGMAFLLRTRFTLDAGAKEIRWWAPPLKGASLPIAYNQHHVPFVYLAWKGEQHPVALDTGSTGDLELPGRLEPEGAGEPGYAHDGTGRIVPETSHILDRIEAASGAWTGIPVHFRKGNEIGSLGRGILFSVPVCLDFTENRLILPMDAKGGLPMPLPRRLSLPVAWDRTGREPRLVVVWVKPGSPMERAGCKAGDEIVQAGNLSGPSLNRRALMALMDRGRYHVWTVRRDGLTEHLPMFVQEEP